MHQDFNPFFGGQAAPWTDNQLLLVRATLAGIALSPTSAPDVLQDAAWAFEGLCVRVEHVVDSVPGNQGDELIQRLCFHVRAGLADVRRELVLQVAEPYRPLVRARALLLRAIVVLTEVRDVVMRELGEPPLMIDPVELARAIVLIAVRARATDHDFIVLVGEAELNLLARVPEELQGADFPRRLVGLRALLAECANYESRRTVGLERELRAARRTSGALSD